jgi:hypothetical protein
VRCENASELARDAGGKRAVSEEQRATERACGEIVQFQLTGEMGPMLSQAEAASKAETENDSDSEAETENDSESEAETENDSESESGGCCWCTPGWRPTVRRQRRVAPSR